jgi:hypothetical protein
MTRGRPTVASSSLDARVDGMKAVLIRVLVLLKVALRREPCQGNQGVVDVQVELDRGAGSLAIVRRPAHKLGRDVAGDVNADGVEKIDGDRWSLYKRLAARRQGARGRCSSSPAPKISAEFSFPTSRMPMEP